MIIPARTDYEAHRRRMHVLVMKENSELTDDELMEILSDRYTADIVPSCSVCGKKLSLQSMGGGSTTYGCPGANDSEHYEKSIWISRKDGDSVVLELIKRFCQLKKI
jgi:hypothetical protein